MSADKYLGISQCQMEAIVYTVKPVLRAHQLIFFEPLLGEIYSYITMSILVSSELFHVS